MKKHAIVTAAIGDNHIRLSRLTMPLLRDYSKRIDADLIVIEGQLYRDRPAYWEKFRMGDYIEKYERLAWMDLDLIVHPKAESIFDAAPEGYFSAFDEGLIFTDRQEQLFKDAEFYGIHPSQFLSWSHAYFNSGVMVFGHDHRNLFLQPKSVKLDSIMPEQTLLNLRLASWNVPCFDLTSHWNGLHSIHPPGSRAGLNVVHYAGWPKTADWVDVVTKQMRVDLAGFK